MYPVIFQWGKAALQTYSVMISLTFFTGLALWIWQGKRVGLKTEKQISLALIAFFSGLVGARLLAVLTQWKRYASGELGVSALWEGGIVYLGGFIAAFGIFHSLAPRMGLPRKLALNTAAPALCFEHAVGRIGCFLNGCCFGTVCALTWGVTYTNPLSVAPQGLPLHPSQLYESIGLIALGFLLLRHNKRPFIKLETINLYLLFYVVLRFFVEFSRGDLLRGVHWGLSTSQWLSLGLIFVALLLDFPDSSDHKKAHEN